MNNHNERRARQNRINDQQGAESQLPMEDSIARSRGPIRILRLNQVMEVVGLSRAMIYQLQAERRFPMRVRITCRAVGWIEEEVQAWLAKRVETSDRRARD